MRITSPGWRSAIALASGAIGLVLVGGGCDRASLDTGASVTPPLIGDAGTDAVTGPDAPIPDPTGDQAVFSAIEALIEVTEFDARNYEARDPTTGIPPIRFGLGLRVTINGGTSEGRVPGLSVFASGMEVKEGGSAGFPQQFNYQYYPDPAIPGSRFVVEFRYMGAIYAVPAEPIAAEITAPRQGEPVSPSANLLVRWQGSAARPPTVTCMSFLPAPMPDTGCTAGFTLSSMAGNEALFAPLPANSNGREPPCVGEVRVDWGPTAQLVPVTPFRSLSVTRTVWRIQRVAIAP